MKLLIAVCLVSCAALAKDADHTVGSDLLTDHTASRI